MWWELGVEQGQGGGTDGRLWKASLVSGLGNIYILGSNTRYLF